MRYNVQLMLIFHCQTNTIVRFVKSTETTDCLADNGFVVDSLTSNCIRTNYKVEFQKIESVV